MPNAKKLQRFKDGRAIAGHGLAAVDYDPKSNEGDYEPSGRPLPARVDLRKHCSAVENQEQTNSCCANALAGAFEYNFKRQADKTGTKPAEVSRLFIYFEGRKWDLQSRGRGHMRVQDVGMSIPGAVDAMHDSGACLQKAWPFEVGKVNAKPPSNAFTEAVNYKISASRRVPVDAEAMKAALADGHVILTGLKLTKKFFHPGKRGLIATPDPNDPKSASHGLHAMLIVGYSEKHQVFIYRNSWGEKWGDKGYGYVPYEYAANKDFNFCGQYAILGLSDPDNPTGDDDDDDVDDLIADGTEGDDEDDDAPDSDEEDGESDKEDEEHDPREHARKHVLKKVFDKWDVNENGDLRRFELLGAMNNMGFRCALKKVEEIMKAHDTDGRPGSVNFEEWLVINGYPNAEDDANEANKLDFAPKHTVKKTSSMKSGGSGGQVEAVQSVKSAGRVESVKSNTQDEAMAVKKTGSMKSGGQVVAVQSVKSGERETFEPADRKPFESVDFDTQEVVEEQVQSNPQVSYSTTTVTKSTVKNLGTTSQIQTTVERTTRPRNDEDEA